MNTRIIGLLLVVANLICIRTSHAQTETLTVQGSLPRLNYRDTGGNLLWALPANNVLWKLDGPFNGGVIVVTAAAPSSSIVANQGGVSIRGGGFPSAKLHVGNISDPTQPGEVKIDPGNPAATGSIFVQNQSLDAELRLVTQSAAKQSSVRMISPNGHFTTFVSGTSGRYIVRDITNAVSPITIIPGPLNSNTLVLKNGRIGVGVLNPTSPIHVSNGATCSTGGVWVNASSRDLKQDIQELSVDEAAKAMQTLKPVTYAYKSAPEDPQVGFIAEDVPELVATADRKGLSPIDVVAVLTKVVQEQQKTMERQQDQLQQQAEQLAAIQRDLRLLKQK
jgi:hypothetical protein